LFYAHQKLIIFNLNNNQIAKNPKRAIRKMNLNILLMTFIIMITANTTTAPTITIVEFISSSYSSMGIFENGLSYFAYSFIN